MKTWYDRYVFWRLGPAARLAYIALQDPDLWEFDNYYIAHKRSKMCFWVGSAVNEFKLYKPREADVFNRFETKVLVRAVKNMQRTALFANLGGLS